MAPPSSPDAAALAACSFFILSMFLFFSSSIFFRASSLAFAAADLAPPDDPGEVPVDPGEGAFFFCGVPDLRVGFGLLVGVAGDMRDDESRLPT